MMEELVNKGEDLLPEGLPEGWKVEIRVRKTGKKDRYYTDPVNGYIFRSIKDIDRYLLTGKLGRHVTKSKPVESESDTAGVEHDEQQHTDELQKKEPIESDETKEACLGLEAQVQKPCEDNAPKRKASSVEEHESKGVKKSVRRPSSERSSRSTKKKEITPFFILDSDHCDESDELDIPHLSEIIDSIRKDQDNPKNVYVSAPAIGSLLGGRLTSQPTTTKPNQDHNFITPLFPFNIPQKTNYPPNMTYPPSSEPTHIIRPYQYTSPFERLSKLGNETTPPAIGVPGCALLGNLLTDPCIDFAFKTLTGTTQTQFGNNAVAGDGFTFPQQQLGTSRMFSDGGPCQS